MTEREASEQICHTFLDEWKEAFASQMRGRSLTKETEGSKDQSYQNMNNFLWFLVIHGDSIDLLQLIPNMNKACYTKQIAVYTLKLDYLIWHLLEILNTQD